LNGRGKGGRKMGKWVEKRREKEGECNVVAR